MGGLVTRAYIHSHRPSNLGRVVMIGSPNGGSELADSLRGNPIYRKVLGAAGQQLVTDQSGFGHLFGSVGYELGIIVGSNILNPVAARLFKGPNDGKVSVARTLVEGCADHIVLKRNHTLLPLSQAARVETAFFLHHGRFTETASRMIHLPFQCPE